MSERVAATVGTNRHAQVDLAYQLAFARHPTPQESEDAARSLSELAQLWMSDDSEGSERSADQQALATWCHVLLNSPEFIYVD